ncbi:S41 family peptidase [Myroides phaeus]|uniref:Carboxyl-terminal processing protease n=1 Tax=Myroides phaeus TaxID=702745 RepID=A0A1G8E754_9FLAO|nr:S41 family peptidase [Myroides phaeus]SDH65725.1 carboxyl-terminal processing protease [Myroides phaeus]
MKKYYWPLIISISLALGVLLGGFVVSASQKGRSGFYTNHNKLKLNRLLDFIEQEYVDNVNTDSIVDKTVSTILEQLDPHSIYIAKNDMQSVTESMKGSFVGIGVQYYFYKDSIAVIKEIANGPAMKAGVKAGDRILKADDITLFGKNISTDTIAAVLRGAENTDVVLSIYRKTTGKTFDIVVNRQPIPIKSVDVAIKLEDGKGYIKINRFASTTYNEFRVALEKLVAADISGLVLDLRDNGGGYMDQAIKMLDDLLDKGLVVVKTINKGGQETVNKSRGNGIFTEKPLYVLIDENSASASEIIAGAIQDNDRGVIVGRRSFGKGLVQRELMLGDGSAIRLTTARYYTPSGRSIQKSYSNGIKSYNDDFKSRYEHGELYAADSIKVADSLQFKTLKGKIVYGGGGIVPDLFVPIAEKHGEENTIMLMRSNIVNYFVFGEIDKDRNKFTSMKQAEVFAYVQNSDKVYKGFIKHLEASNLFFKLDSKKELIKRYLAAEFINQLYGPNEYYTWLMKTDPMIIAIDKKK